MNELIGKYYAAPQFDDYKADVEMPLPMIYQSGYLTIKGYAKEYQADSRTIHLIGANFSSEEGTVNEWKEGPSESPNS